MSPRVTGVLVFVLLAVVLAAAAPAAEWVPNTFYATNTLVTYQGPTYKCLQGHTSLAGWEPPNVAALWQLQQGTPRATATATATTRPTATTTATTRATATPTSTTRATATATTAPRATATATTAPRATATATNPVRATATPTSPGGIPSLAQSKLDEAALTSSALFQSIKDSMRTLANSAVEIVAPGRGDNPVNVKRVEAILPQTKWDTLLFPRREGTYTYQRFLQSIAKFPAVCGTYSDGRDSDAICRKALATMFAHFAQETGGHNPSDSVAEWRQGLVFLRESGCTETGPGCGYNGECSANNWITEAWPCGKNPDGSFKKYFGRGAKQLSYNYNYGPFSQFMFGDVRPLLDNPDQVASTWLNLASAVFFYVYPQPPKPSMLHVIDRTWVPNATDAAAGLNNSFASTIMIINGGIECTSGTDKPQAVNRANYYLEFARELNVPTTGELLSCKSQQPFSAGGAGALSISWEKDWHTGAEYKCMLVSYQTAYSALIPGDYQKCVEKGWGITLR